jgi:hypothetical protein
MILGGDGYGHRIRTTFSGGDDFRRIRAQLAERETELAVVSALWSRAVNGRLSARGEQRDGYLLEIYRQYSELGWRCRHD